MINAIPLDVKYRVDCGAQFLDENVPDWFKRINVQFLDMCELDTCILGQLYGNYQNGTRELFGDIWLDRVGKYGFSRYGTNIKYSDLKECWINEISARL